MDPTMLLDVAIIGGGPAGLATAHALLAVYKNIKIKVFERNEDLNARGAGLRLEPHGLKALFAINKNLLKDIFSHSITLRKHIDLTHEGIEIKTVDILALNEEAEEKFGFGYPILRWSDIRKCLVENLQDGILELGYKFYKLEQEAEEVKVFFHKSTSKNITQIIRAKFVIGADGYFSKVRSQIVGDGHPNFQNAVHWRAFVPKEKLKVDIEPYTSRLYLGDNRIGLIYWINNAIVWSLCTSINVCEEEGVDLNLRIGQSGIQSDSDFTSGNDSKYKDICLKLFSGFSKDVINLIKSTEKDSVLQHGVYMRDEADFNKKAFGVGRVALVGDAIHVLGTSTAFGDAHTLARAFAKHGFSPETTCLYSNLRYDFVKRSLATTSKIGSVIFNSEGTEANAEALCNSRGFEEYKNSIKYEDLSKIKITYKFSKDVNNMFDNIEYSRITNT